MIRNLFKHCSVNDVLREKGYVVIDNSDLKPFKNYSSPLSNDNDVSFYTLAKKYMDEDYFERFINGEGTAMESGKFLMQLKNNKEKYSKEIIDEFEINEQQVEEQITAVRKFALQSIALKALKTLIYQGFRAFLFFLALQDNA